MTAVVGIGACTKATTQVSGQWEPNAVKKDRYSKVLVVSLASKSARRQEFENGLVAAISGVRTEAFSAQYLVTEDTVMDRETVSKLVKETGADSVLVTRVTDQVIKPKEITEKTDSANVVGTSDRFNEPFGDFGSGSTFNFVQYDYKENIDAEDYLVAEMKLALESEFYDIRTGLPVYKIIAVAEHQTETSKMIADLSKKIGNKLRGSGLIGQ